MSDIKEKIAKLLPELQHPALHLRVLDFEALIKEQVIAELNNVLLVGRLVQDEYEALKATEAYVENRIKELKK